MPRHIHRFGAGCKPATLSASAESAAKTSPARSRSNRSRPGIPGRELNLEPIQHGSSTPKRSAFAATAGVAIRGVGLFLFFVVELDIIAEPHVVLLGDPGEIALDRQVGIGDDAQFL